MDLMGPSLPARGPVLLVDTKLVDHMKAFGQWEDWVAGRRGVSRFEVYMGRATPSNSLLGRRGHLDRQ